MRGFAIALSSAVGRRRGASQPTDERQDRAYTGHTISIGGIANPLVSVATSGTRIQSRPTIRGQSHIRSGSVPSLGVPSATSTAKIEVSPDQ